MTEPTRDTRQSMVVELDADAVRLLGSETFRANVAPWTPRHDPLGPLRLAMVQSPWSEARSHGYRIAMCREQAEELLRQCVRLAERLVDTPGAVARASSRQSSLPTVRWNGRSNPAL